MAAGIVYLDVDDEITSAASRIRSSPGTKVALVVPYGSRIATSRMNFRLLSREAVVSNRRLSIVAGDAAARSLAASAGLPVFGTVAEYESSLDVSGSSTAVEPSADPVVEAVPAAPDDVADASLATSATIVAAPSPPPEPPAPPAAAVETAPRRSQRPQRPVPEEPSPAARLAAPDAAALAPAESLADDEAVAAGLPPLFGTRIRAPIAAAIGLIALAVVVLAAGAYVFLPAATIVVVPHREPIAPIQLTVSADPTATAVDAANLVVPAVRVDVPVEASKEFTTTGTHVEETAAHGAVTFTNYDTSSGVSIPSGSIVSTEGGTRFRTNATVALQPAAVFPDFEPTSDSVSVTAVKPGETGNVPANTIRVVPQGQDPVLLRVNNPAETSGGTHTETPEVKKAEVEKAVATVQADLELAFQNAIEAGADAPPDTTLFPTTAQLGPSTPDVDPQTLVGQAIETFTIRLTATGTVIAVDPRPVQALAETQIVAKVTKGHELVPGSVKVQVGEGLVGEDGMVSFLATAQATQVAVVDADAIRQLVKGKTAADATAALTPFGTATVTIWPDWASTVTSLDPRLTVSVDAGPTAGNPQGSQAPGPSARPSASRPAASRSPAASVASPSASPS
ncbi:MAG TPA: baseplate J/gp47 family protein [Candidatus Limnocylindrales bacterium]|nr:baseplate J/gp47 family protein [Candidatus Limnocylindrales bacterium]